MQLAPEALADSCGDFRVFAVMGFLAGSGAIVRCGDCVPMNRARRRTCIQKVKASQYGETIAYGLMISVP
jgi:hypothetical protein